MSRKTADAGVPEDFAVHTVKRARRTLRWRNRLSGAVFRTRRS